MKNTEKIIAIVGPTASGKTDLAIKLAGLINGEIISADSRLVYRDFNIGTAKPTAEELALVPHYMIDIVDPIETYTVGTYKKQANKVIQDIQSKNKVPIIVGGTGFYIKALLEGLDIPDIKPDMQFRKQMNQLEQEKGKEFLYEKLKKIDPEAAAKLHPNDSFRVIRALEVQELSGTPISKAQTTSKPEYNTLYIGLNFEDRECLYERINKRVHFMLDQGLIEETESLVNKYGKTLPLLRTLGYKEISEYLDKLYSLEEATEEIQRNTRRFAKRQLTWFRANNKIQWYFIDKMLNNEICEAVIKAYND